ncbi:MAG: hypothetical protein K8R02_04460 [Anaerohalosphaeraceae bacterium]|nr:hypothetical protein [Anaerohalosphaeraceae bacterium]
MENATGYIIKDKDITLDGKFVLSIGNTAGKNAGSSKTGNSDFQVRIVENQAEFAVMEVMCGCGKKANVKCEYVK